MGNLATVITDNFTSIMKDVREAISKQTSDGEPDPKRQKIEEDKCEFSDTGILLKEVTFQKDA